MPQYAFERRVQIAIQQNVDAQQAKNIDKFGLSGGTQPPLILDDTQGSLLDNLNALAPEDASDTSSIASSVLSGFRSFRSDDLDDSDGRGGNLAPRLTQRHDEPLRILPMPRELKGGAVDEVQCPFCKLTLRPGMSEKEWE